MEKEITGIYSLSKRRKIKGIIWDFYPGFLRQSGPSAIQIANSEISSRQREADNYETNVKVGTMQWKLDFKKGDHPAACRKYLTTSYIPKASDVAVL